MSNYTSSNVVNNNNSRMRRVSSYSHSRPIVQNHRTLMETQKEKVETYFRNKLDVERNLKKITIVCFDKKDNSSQLIFNFLPENATIFYKCKLTIINGYLKTSELYHTISPFGNVAELLYTLVFNILKQNTPIKQKRCIGVLLEKTTNTYTTNQESQDLCNSVDITIDKTESGTNSNNECPICLTKFEKIERITLKCHHKICRDCLFNSIDNKLYSCPMCRKPIFPVSNANANANANLPEEHIENENDVNMEL